MFVVVCIVVDFTIKMTIWCAALTLLRSKPNHHCALPNVPLVLTSFKQANANANAIHTDTQTHVGAGRQAGTDRDSEKVRHKLKMSCVHTHRR